MKKPKRITLENNEIKYKGKPVSVTSKIKSIMEFQMTFPTEKKEQVWGKLELQYPKQFLLRKLLKNVTLASKLNATPDLKNMHEFNFVSGFCWQVTNPYTD